MNRLEHLPPETCAIDFAAEAPDADELASCTKATNFELCSRVAYRDSDGIIHTYQDNMGECPVHAVEG
ncbi:MAG: hypothetical protein WC498_01865 [Candidatus Saccharimonadales bacterium]